MLSTYQKETVVANRTTPSLLYVCILANVPVAAAADGAFGCESISYYDSLDVLTAATTAVARVEGTNEAIGTGRSRFASPFPGPRFRLISRREILTVACRLVRRHKRFPSH